MIPATTRIRRSAKRPDLTARARELDRRLTRSYGPPHRERYDPLDELILTILSQNTSDVNRDQAYARLRERFSTWEEVRAGPRRRIESAIRPAGLWKQKARAIQGFLKALRAERGTLGLDHLRQMNDAEVLDYLTRFRGVGTKTAACVLCFSLDRATMPVDTHVHRLARRLGIVPPRASPDKAHELLNGRVPPELRFSLHIQLIRHGRRVCTARKPRCPDCALNDLCPKVGVPTARSAGR